MSSSPVPALRAQAASKPGPRRRFATLRTVVALILREMSTRYGRSPGGYAWALLEPIGAIIVLSVGFSLLLRSPSLGNSFLLFYATGYLPLNLYSIISGTAAGAIMFSKPLLTYPTVTWVDAILARVILNTLTSAMVIYLILTGILTFVETTGVIDLIPMLQSVGLALLMGLSIGVLNCALFGVFPVWRQVWGIVTRPLLIMSGLFYIYEDLPQVARELLWYNPLIHITGLMRMGTFSMYHPDYINIPYVIGFAMLPLALGIVLLSRYHRDILNN